MRGEKARLGWTTLGPPLPFKFQYFFRNLKQVDAGVLSHVRVNGTALMYMACYTLKPEY